VSERPRPPLPKRPYRDSVLLNLVLAGLIVLISWATGGSLGRAVVFASLYFVIATAWAWWRFRQRLERERP
jgi:membrane protein implicated in regulation of membrane protease activity